jgi:hypothetical protein
MKGGGGSRDSKPPDRRDSAMSARVFWCTAIAATGYALWWALRRSWVCDDAFISFRYADNLVRGLGLVYNEGERVEGYSNFLWTMYHALGLKLGADVENWANAGSIACFLGSLGVLTWNSWVTRRESSGLVTWIPVAAVLAALHPDWQFFATSGLETSLFALEITLLYVVLTVGPSRSSRAAVAGLLLTLASMTRPDGLLLTVPVAIFVLLTAPRRLPALLALSAAFLITWIPYTLWRVSYFGDFFPNTYYAKSAAMAWYSQGAAYAALYFARYWPLLLGPILVVLAWPRGTHAGDRVWRVASDPWRGRVALAALLLAAYVWFVLRVGGDFMFGRFLIPVTPLLFVLLELGITRLTPGRLRTPWLFAMLVAGGILLTPYPLPRDPFGDFRGIVFEPNFYPRDGAERTRAQGLALRPFFDGLPVRVAFFGGEARLVYYARPQTAIECATGLTDRQIARSPLKGRGRIGHEKQASMHYVLDDRRAHFSFTNELGAALRLDREIPHVTIEMGGVQGLVLTWEDALMNSLRRRGALFTDFPAELETVLENPALLQESRNEGWLSYDKVHRFYFAQSNDPRRQALLQQRLRESETPAPTR